MYKGFLDLIRNSSLPVCLLSFYTFIWFLQIGNRVGFLGAIRIEFIVGAVLGCFSISEWIKEKKQKHKPDFYHKSFIKIILVWYFVLIIYSVFTFDPGHSWYVFTERILKFSMFTLFLSTLVKNEYELKLVLLGFMLAMAKIIQEGIFGVATGGMVWENQGIPRLHGVTKMYRHPNSLSGLAVSALPFFLLLFRFQKLLVKLAMAIAVFGLILIVLYTGSRTGYVATLLMFMAILFRLGVFKLKTIFILSLLIPLTFVLIPEEYKGRFETMFKSEEERGSSANKRIEILKDAWEVAKKYPMGVGVQAFPYVREKEFGRAQDTHNLYLEILTNLGPMGLIVFSVFIYSLFKINMRSRRIFKRSENKFLLELTYVINLYILCRLALGLFGMDLYEVYWWYAAGFTIILAKFGRNELKRVESIGVGNRKEI